MKSRELFHERFELMSFLLSLTALIIEVFWD
jgi:hypothetical protein